MNEKKQIFEIAWETARALAEAKGGKAREYFSFALKAAWDNWKGTQRLWGAKVIKKTDKALRITYFLVCELAGIIERTSWLPKSVIVVDNNKYSVKRTYDIWEQRYAI